MVPLSKAAVGSCQVRVVVVSVSTTTKASSHDELTTMIANRDDEKLAVIGIARTSTAPILLAFGLYHIGADLYGQFWGPIESRIRFIRN